MPVRARGGLALPSHTAHHRPFLRQAVENALVRNNYIPMLIGYEHLPDLPDHCAADGDNAPLRRLSALESPSQVAGVVRVHGARLHELLPAGLSVEAWLLSWRKRLGCWFIALPGSIRMQLENCIGALGIHIASRLEAAMRATSALVGDAAALQPPSVTVLSDAMAAHCEWLGDANVLGLPEFPPLIWLGGGGGALVQPSIPRLLPAWQQLQSLAERHLAISRPARLPKSRGQGTITFALGLGLSTSLGIMLLSARQGRCRLRRRTCVCRPSKMDSDCNARG